MDMNDNLFVLAGTSAGVAAALLLSSSLQWLLGPSVHPLTPWLFWAGVALAVVALLAAVEYRRRSRPPRPPAKVQTGTGDD